MNDTNRPPGFWAKLKKDGDRVVAWLSVLEHGAHVAACTEALLDRTLLGKRLATLAGLAELPRSTAARLCVFAALHDAGKCNHGFQNKAVPAAHPRAGHLSEILGFLFGRVDLPRRQELLDALSADDLLTWGREEDVSDLLVATFSHHGRPVDADAQVDPRLWAVRNGVDPIAGVAEIVQATRRWYPEAWDADADPLPEQSAFHHAWAGVLNLADWIGSDSKRFFPVPTPGDGDPMPDARRRALEALRKVGLDTAAPRESLGPDLPAYEWKGPSFDPYPAQLRVLDLPRPSEGSVALLEAATGAGKTEAALAHYLRLFHAGLVDGLYFALPTRTAASQIYRRVIEAVHEAFPEASRPPVVQAVPGYIEVDGVKGVPLPEFEVRWPDDPHERLRHRGWAGEHSKRYLAGAVVVGTVDQVLLSALTVSHAHLRASSLLRHLLVVDEVHASDVYMGRVLESVLDAHVAAGGHAFLMSATLGSAARARLLAAPGQRARAEPPPLDEAVALPYPALSVSSAGTAPELLAVCGRPRSKAVTAELVAEMENPEAVATRALEAARAGAKVAVLRNTVSACRDTQEALEAAAGEDRSLLFSCNGVVAPHHSRFARPDRLQLDQAVEAAFGKERPEEGGCAVVATQTIEQSVDLDADLLITDLAPIDVLLQRIGRLHRHVRDHRPPGYETARVVVLVPGVGDLSELIGPKGKPSGRHGLGSVYEDLRALETTWRRLARQPEMELPADNRELVETALHPEVLERLMEGEGGRWKRHWEFLQGNKGAERRLAELNRLPTEKPFSEVGFPAKDSGRRVPTRLGADDRLARFPEPMASPFGQRFDQLTLPEHYAQGVPADVETAEDVTVHDGGLTFRYGARKLFRYDRRGLFPVEAKKE